MTRSATRLHIGYVLRVFPSLSQTFVLNEIIALQSLGYRVTVLSLLDPGSIAWRQVPRASGQIARYLAHDGSGSLVGAFFWLLRRHPLRFARTLVTLAVARSSLLWRAFAPAALVARQAQADGLDHIHAHLRRGTDVAWLAHRLTGRGFSFTAHATNVFVPEKSCHVPAELSDCDFALTVCNSNKELLARRSPHSRAKIHVMRPFLDRELFPTEGPQPNSTSDMRHFRLVSVGRLVPKKGVAVLIEAVHLLARRGIPIHTDIVGEGPERPKLESLIGRLGLAGSVSLVGAMDAGGVRAMLRRADCFALASVRAPDGDSDATPTVIGEAMAVGLPVVSTRLGGIPEIVPEGAGLLVEPDDPLALAEAIASVALMSPTQRRAMGERGYAYVRSNWNSERDAPRLSALFQEAVLIRARA